MRIDSDGLDIDQLAIADFSGIAVAAKGRIDTRAQSPRGAVTLNLDARSIDGVTALVEKFAPQAADELRRLAGRVTPVALRGSLTLDPAAPGSTGTNAMAKFKVDGRAGTFLVALQGDTGIASDAFKVDDLAKLSAAEVNVSGRLDADDGDALIDLIGLETPHRRGQATGTTQHDGEGTARRGACGRRSTCGGRARDFGHGHGPCLPADESKRSAGNQDRQCQPPVAAAAGAGRYRRAVCRRR